MIKEIVKDTEILTQKSEKFIVGQDEPLIQDMIDTASEFGEHCVGLACVQIGVPKRVIIVKQGDKFVPYRNPSIIGKSPKTYTAEETCLSLEGKRTVRRHKQIKLLYVDKNGKSKIQVFSGFIAQIIQHECDHLNGVLI